MTTKPFPPTERDAHLDDELAPPKKVLFLCTGNSCRSQMAEAWVNTLRKDSWKAYSAGIETHGMNPHAMKVMQESGVDMAEQYSKHVDEISHEDFDMIITVCDHAAEHCPTVDQYSSHHQTPVRHVPFDDPPKLAAAKNNDADALDSYRMVRDQIRDYVASPGFDLA